MSQGTASSKKSFDGCESQLSTNKERLRELLNWFLPDDAIFASIKFHGNTKWLPHHVVFLALCWAWSNCVNVTDAFADAVGWCGKLLKGCPFVSYTGFMDAMTKWHFVFIDLLGPVLHARMREIGGEFWQTGKWIFIAFDGSRATAPRTVSNEDAFCAPNYGNGQTAMYRQKKLKNARRGKKAQAAKRRKKKAKTRANTKAAQAALKKKAVMVQAQTYAPQEPQAWITLMWHVGLRLPWMWRLGPSNSSEREHVMQMIEKGIFLVNTLFCGDAGFVGYPLWSKILSKGHHFMVRVGANVSLLSENTDYLIQEDGIVLCWPLDSIRANNPPLRLRLVKVLIGKTQVWILTSVLNPQDLTKQEILRNYKMRWGIEIEFRGLKQTLNKADLRCRSAERLLAELNWSIMAMAVAELFSLKEQLSKKPGRKKKNEPDPNPAKRSLANTIRALRGCLKDLDGIPKPNKDLRTLLRKAITDSYIRTSSKKARYRPSNPDKKPLGDPKVRQMTPEEKMKLLSMEEKQAA